MIHFPNVVIIIALSLLILHTVLIDITTVKGDPDTARLGGECGPETWVMGDPYGTLVEQMLNELAVECAQEPTHEISFDYTSGDLVAHGLATCSPSLSEEDCKACLAVAQERLLTECPFCKSAWIELVDCFMSYSN